MSHYATAFIVINLGCEMIYVIDQRLRAQKVPADKAEKVLTEITAVLFHPKLVQELFLPQPVSAHAIVKRLLHDIASTSIMKLDDYSTNKLWDLMTMIFKWQISIATNQNIYTITNRHLKNVAMLMPQFFPKTIFEFTLRKFEELSQKITDEDFQSLRNTMLLWFSEYHTKISILIRLRLQKRDGSFVSPLTVNSKILANLGENIYYYDKKENQTEEFEKQCSETHEINCLLGDIKPKAENIVEIQLPIFNNKELRNVSLLLNRDSDPHFSMIDTNVKGRSTDLSFSPSTSKSAQDYLLEMLNDDQSKIK